MVDGPSAASSRTSWKGMQGRFLLALGSTFLFLEILFLGDISYLSGTEYHQAQRYHALDILYVDYDQGVVGQSVVGATAPSKQLHSRQFTSNRLRNIPTWAMCARQARNRIWHVMLCLVSANFSKYSNIPTLMYFQPEQRSSGCIVTPVQVRVTWH